MNFKRGGGWAEKPELNMINGCQLQMSRTHFVFFLKSPFCSCSYRSTKTSEEFSRLSLGVVASLEFDDGL